LSGSEVGIGWQVLRDGAGGFATEWRLNEENNLELRVDFMVKLLRACVWMPWRKKAKKDVASCEKPRGDASNR
jgi:hypothetical protein